MEIAKLLPPASEEWGTVMFSHASVCLFTEGEGTYLSADGGTYLPADGWGGGTYLPADGEGGTYQW